MTSVISLSSFCTSNLHIIRPKLILSTRTLQIAEGTRGRPLFQIVAIGLLLTLIGTIGVATETASTNESTI